MKRLINVDGDDGIPIRAHAVFGSLDMSSAASRRSIDTAESPRQTPPSNQYPFPQIDSAKRPGLGGRYDTRRGSTASSITSIGSIMDSSMHDGASSIAESGSNG